MSGEGYFDLHERIKISDRTWEEEIKRLKHDIKRTENRIIMTEKRRKLLDKVPFNLDLNLSDADCSENVEGVMTGRESPPGGTNAFRVVDSPAKREESPSHAVWVSPSKVMRKRPKKIDLFDTSSTEMKTKRESLSSPKRIRQQEWSPPHRVIDRPKPEDSYGNWVTLHCESNPNEEDRPISQATYTVRRCIFVPEANRAFVRKVAVLDDFNPGTRKGTDHVVSGNDRIKRSVQPDGRVVKVSTLDDFSGLSKLEEKHPECENTMQTTGEAVGGKTTNRTTSKKAVLTDLGRPSVSTPRKTRIIRRVVEKKNRMSSPDKDESKKEEDQNNKENKPRNGKVKDDEGKTNEEVDAAMTDLEKILNDRKDEDEATTKRKTEERKKREDAKKAKTVVEEEDEKRKTDAGKRRRDVDLKAVQKYIKMQKVKRSAQLKMEREKKAVEEEERKKKLENLRIRTLELAATSKRKAPETAQVTSTIKIVEPPEAETEEDVTMSLGLKQTKPKVSYNESILNLKKKPQVAARQETKKQELVTGSEIQKPEEEKEELRRLCSPTSTVPPKLETPRSDVEKTTNLALKKLAETLQKTMEQQKKAASAIASSSPCKSYRNASAENSDRELAESRKVITVDVETIKSLKQDIKKISQNFQILHEIIADKSAVPAPSVKETNPEPIQSSRVSQLSLTSRVKSKSSPVQLGDDFPSWLRIVLPRPHPYNVLTAVRNKMKVTQRSSCSYETSENTVYSDAAYSGSESFPVTSNRLTSLSTDQTELVSSTEAKMEKSSSEENYFSPKEDSGSEFSSSILDSEKERFFSKREALIKPADCLKIDSTMKDSSHSSITEDIASMDVHNTSLDSKKVTSSRESLVLVPPDIQLKCGTNQPKTVSDRSDVKSLTIYSRTDTITSLVTDEPIEEIVSKREAFIRQIEDTATESVKSKSERVETAVARVSEMRPSQSAFNPEALHLQIQAELSLLETFQRSLANFLDEERMKAITQRNIKVDKAVNTEEILPVETKAEESIRDEDTESVKTELDVARTQEEATESIKTETEANDHKSAITELISEHRSTEATDETKPSKKKSSEKLDISDIVSGISFQMLNRMMKDEELRSEHQLALIRLREKTLNEKVKAELTLLEMRKKALKEKGSSEDLAISAIKKKQRGILLKYQNEREDIERLKKMHRIASEERKIMIKQQKQLRQMQLTTKDMLIKLKKREKSPQKRTPVKLKPAKYYDSQSEVPEAISLNVSENTFTESITSVDDSMNHSIESDLDVTSKSNVSEGDDEILRRNMKTLEDKISKSTEKSAPAKMLMSGERKHLKRGHSAEELLKWTKRLEEKENRLKEMEMEAENLSLVAKHRLKSFRDAKTSVRDRSTSPFQFQEVVKSICESSPSLTEAIEAKKSSSIAELIDSNSKSQEESGAKSSEAVPEKAATSASEDIPEEFSKKTPVSSRFEYNSESFESSSDTHRSKAVATKSQDSEVNVNNNGITIKMALSPRVHGNRRRYSSGSDDSVNLFHTETASEQSDVEIRIAALHEQLRRRKLEAERLRREQKKAHRERLKLKEQSLLKQIEAYDMYIQKKKQELEQEYERSSLNVVKPVVKQAKSGAKRAEPAEEENVSFQAKFALRSAAVVAEKDSDSEIAESIKSQLEDGSVREKAAESSIATEVISDTVCKDSTGSTISSVLESLPKQTVASDGSHSESEELTVSNESVKTTLLSPEKPELDIATETEEIEASEVVPSCEEANYSEDSFESDEKSKSTLLVSEDTKEREKETWTENDVGLEVGAEEETPEPESVAEDEVPSEETADEAPEEVPAASREEDRAAIADYITDSVLDSLVTESMAVITKKRRGLKDAETDSGVEVLTNALAAKIVAEVIDDAVSMYNRRRRGHEQKTQDVRRRVHEIMSQAPGTKREQRRPQEIMVTTYGVVAQDDDGAESPEREEFLQSLSPPRQDKPAKAEVGNLDGTSQASEADAYGQEWFDDDFGLSRTRREAEELRVQQLQIEQEIQQLQAQQEQVLYYYLRQIPNKPPPPYTPPGTATTERFTSESEVTAVMSTAVRYLTDEMHAGRQVKEIQAPEAFFSANDSDHVKCYKTFLFDLARHIISGVVGVECQEDRPPWMRTNEKLSKYRVKKVERTYECLFETVMKQVLVLFGFRQKMGKERLIVRWSRKKRDHVDELLVGESQEEEAEWTHYDEDEVTVKNNVTIAILDSLLDETAQLVNAIWTKKMRASD